MLAFTSTMVNAEYIIKIPLEQAQGGHLPNGSIQIGKTAPAPLENLVSNGCIFIEGENASHWTIEIPYSLKQLHWDGQDIERLDSPTEDFLNPEKIDGYVYRPGDYVKRVKRAEPQWDGSDFYIDYYYICREKL